MRNVILLLLGTLLIASPLEAATLYVRIDGGPGDECDGTASAAWDNVDDDVQEACAFNHPNWALPANGQPTTYKMSGGDTLIIEEGSYKMGCQNDTNCVDALYNYTNTGYCYSAWTYECGRADVPSGSASGDTLIVGCSASGCGTGDKPELYMVGRVDVLYVMTDSQYVTFKDIEITDHMTTGCGHGVPVQECGRTAFASGIWSTPSWYNLTFEGMDIHGLANRGFLFGGGGHLHDNGTLLIKNSNIDGNFYAGFDMDTCGNDGTCGVIGNMTFDNVNMRWNGCDEQYPVVWGADGVDGVDGRLPSVGSCREGNNGGYGDMLAASDTGGNWTFTDCNFSHNTSDAIDLLYCGRTNRYPYGTCDITVKRTLFEGNNGQVIKGPNADIEDNLIIANCSFWWENTAGYDAPGFGACRAQGTPISIEFLDSTDTTVYNNTIVAEGDVIFFANGASCEWEVYNNIIIGGYQYCQDTVAMYYTESCATNYTINEDYNICYDKFKDPYSHCSNTNDQWLVDPGFTGTIYNGSAEYTCSSNRYTGTVYYKEFELDPGGNSIDAADTTVLGADSLDVWSVDRGATWDLGAWEYTTGATSCNTDCLLCSDILECYDSAITCYWWNDGSGCKTTEEVEEPNRIGIFLF